MLAFNDPIALATVNGDSGLVTRPQYRTYRLNDKAGRQRALEYIVTCLAGPEAERRIKEPPPEATVTDRTMALTLARRLCAEDDEAAGALIVGAVIFASSRGITARFGSISTGCSPIRAASRRWLAN
jgi:hypothetical protein